MVQKLASSINYIHEACRNYLQSYQEVPTNNEPHRINCALLTCINISSTLSHFYEQAHANSSRRHVNI